MPNWKKVIVSGSNAVLNSITASGNVSGSVTSTASFGTYVGDGQYLDLASNTTISTTPFPFTGDAQISGSLIISQSYTAGDTDSTALRLFGSGSVSQSGIFEVEGSAGPLFSVADGLDGVLMEVNNISGLPLFQVSSSNEVFINRGNLTSGVTTATASFAHFTGSFQGDGGGLTNLPQNSPFTAAGISGSLGTNTALIRTLTSAGISGSLGTNAALIRTLTAAGISGSVSDPFPFAGDAQITGSLTVSGSGGLSVESSGSTVFEVIGSEGTLFSIDDDLDGTIFTANDRSGLPVLEVSASGEVYIGKAPQSLYTTAVISSTTANISQSIFGLSTSSYGGVFVDYTANSGSNARAGSIVSVWNGSSINFTETTTLDIGDTSNLLMQVAISQSQAQVQSYATTAGYNIKTIIRSI